MNDADSFHRPRPLTDDERQRLRKRFLEPEARGDTFVSAETKAAWKCMLDMLEDIDRICRKHDLRYCVIAGTLLGAIRHGGMIPWDEDIDIAMPRRDYDRFLKIAQRELAPPHFLQTWATDPHHYVCFAKIRNSETTSICDWYVQHHWLCNMGISLDLYPLDGIPDGKCTLAVYDRIVRTLLRARWASLDKPAYKTPSRFRMALYRWGFKLVGGKTWLRFLDFVAHRFPMEKCRMCNLSPFRGGIYKNVHWPSRLFASFENCDFEYLRVRVPAGWEEILRLQYGEWDKPVKGASGHAGTLDMDVRRSYKVVLPEKCAHYGYKPEDYARTDSFGRPLSYK